MTPDKPQQALSMPNAPTPPPVFASDPMGKKPKQKFLTPTYLGSGTTPDQTMTGGKQLTGQ